MEPAPEFTEEVEESLAAVFAAVLAAGRNAAAQPFWRFLQQGGRLPPEESVAAVVVAVRAEAQPFWRYLQQGGRLPSGRLLRAALAGRQVYERPDVPLWGEPFSVRPAPDFAGAAPLQSVSSVGHHLAALTLQGEVLCTQCPRKGLFPVPLPWPAAAVSCGRGGALCNKPANCFAVALSRGCGAVCEWPLGAECSSDGVAAVPEEVRGLPAGDPAVAFQAGTEVTGALTAIGLAYGWGRCFGRCEASVGTAVRIAELSGCGIRRFACGWAAVCAETREGELLYLRLPRVARAGSSLVRIGAAGAAFPLRHIPIWRNFTDIVDAAGAIWSGTNATAPDPMRDRLHQSPQPAGHRVESIAFGMDRSVLLTVEQCRGWPSQR
eukprot:TRINITY_DN29418_c0_g1_i1.p1 TRINITY_DN29418_c0_g1~~TRINITY_DN29418_c0_g1_i1.p1  ORF type:complete len:405 (+),score=69.81 TRINITY_DN29418_c0_g1_i1:81-1217(+)